MIDRMSDEDDLSLDEDHEDSVLGSGRGTLESEMTAFNTDEDSSASPRTRREAQAAQEASMARARAQAGSFRSFLLSAGVAELIGSFFLTFLTLSSLFACNAVGDDALSAGSMLLLSLSYGFSYGCCVYAFSLSGGGYVPSIRQMNPAVTLALKLTGKIDSPKAAVLVLAQLLGAFSGCVGLFLCFGLHSLRTFELFDGSNFVQKLMMSVLVTFLFIFVLLITNFPVMSPTLQQSVSADTSEQSPQTVHELNSIMSALLGMCCSAVTTPLSGCFMNPLIGVTVLGVSSWRNNILVIILGPLLGGCCAALAARLFTYRTRMPFMTQVRWGSGGVMSGLGLNGSYAQAAAATAQAHARQHQHHPRGTYTQAQVDENEERSGSRF